MSSLPGSQEGSPSAAQVEEKDERLISQLGEGRDQGLVNSQPTAAQAISSDASPMAVSSNVQPVPPAVDQAADPAADREADSTTGQGANPTASEDKDSVASDEASSTANQAANVTTGQATDLGATKSADLTTDDTKVAAGQPANATTSQAANLTATQAAKPPTTAPVVCVPVKLDAFVLNEALFNQERKSKIAAPALPEYAALGRGLFQKPDIIDHIDLQTAAPIERNSRITDVTGSGRIRAGRLGIYLHWVLPKVFRSGITATDTAQDDLKKKRIERGLPAADESTPEHPEFRPVPDRWIICRFLRNGVKKGASGAPGGQGLTDAAAFVVESNLMRETEDFDADCDIEMEAAPFLNTDPLVPAQDQDNYWLGCKNNLNMWRERDPKAVQPNSAGTASTANRVPKFQSPLTVTGSSNPLFADYAPHNTNVFSVRDDLTSYESAEVSYFVLGYYSRSNQDPFTFDTSSRYPAPAHSTILKACFMELSPKSKTPKWVDEAAKNTRLVCHGSLYNVEWNRKEIPVKVPAEDLAQHFESKHPVAVGTDLIDALEAYIEVDAEAEHSGLIHEISALLESEYENVHDKRLAEKEAMKRSFHPAPGGSQWHFSKSSDSPTSTNEGRSGMAQANTTLGTMDVGEGPVAQPPMAVRPSPVEIAILHQLNITQRCYDACKRRSSELQFLLFAEWWKHRAEPPGVDKDLINSEGKQALRIGAIEDKVSQLVSAIRTLSPDLVDDHVGRLGALKQKLKRMLAHPCLNGKIKQAAEHPFYSRKDPALVLIDVENPWPGTGNLSVRLHTDLPSNVKGVDILRRAAQDDIDSTITETSFPGLPGWLTQWKTFAIGRDKLPGSIQDAYQALLEEWALAGPNNDEAVTTYGWKKTQAWWPLFVEWEAQYFHIPWDKWALQEQDAGAVSYFLKNNRILDAKGIRDDVRTVTGRSLVLPQVSRMLRAHVEQLFKRSSPKDLPLTSEKQDEILTKVDELPFLAATMEGFTDHLTTFVHGTHVAPHVENQGGSVVASSANESSLFSAQVMQLLAESSADVSPYGRYLDFTHHRRDGRDNNYSPFKPVTHGQARLTKLNIVDKFGQVVPAMTMLQNQDHGFLLPFVSSSVACQSRDPDNSSDERNFANTVIENSEGQCEFFQLPPSLNQDARMNAFFVVENHQGKVAPSSASVGTIKANGVSKDWRPCLEWENPIWAWLMVNFRDGGLQIFHGDGTFIAEVILRTEKVYWQPRAPFEDSDSSDDSSDDMNQDSSKEDNLAPELADFLEKLRSPTYLQTLMGVIVNGLDNLHHAPNSFASELPAIFGRPLALVNTGWSLELAEAPLLDQSTSVNLAAAPRADSIMDYRFALKLGDEQSYSDGLIGFFQQKKDLKSTSAKLNSSDTQKMVNSSGAELEFGRIITDFCEPFNSKDVTSNGLICAKEYPMLKPFFIDPLSQEPETFECLRNQELHIFAALVDPFSEISGYTGVLPPKKLQLPAWTVEQALKQITPFLSVGPALIPSDIPDASLLPVAIIGAAAKSNRKLTPPDVQHESHDPPTIPVQIPGGGEWLWLQPYLDDDDVVDIDFRAIRATSAAPDATKLDLLDGPHTAISGFLQLKTQPPDLIGDTLDDVSVGDFGAFFGDESLRLEISGRGSCGGVPEEQVDIIFNLAKEAVTSKAPDWRNDFPAQFVLAITTPVDAVATTPSKEFPLTINERLTIGYKRPRRDYTLTASIRDKATDLTFPFKLNIPVSAKRVHILSAEYSTFDIPTTVMMGQSFEGTVTLRDRLNNICQGYDDSLFLNFEGVPEVPKILPRSTDYQAKFKPPSVEKLIVSISLDDEPLDVPTRITAFPEVNLAKSVLKGSALCSGKEKEKVNLSILLVDRKGAYVSKADVKVSIAPAASPQFAVASKVMPPAKEGDKPWWVATFIRPAVGTYKVHVKVNSRRAPLSPFTVISTAQPVTLDFSHISFSFATMSKSQTVALRILDAKKRRWYNDVSTLRAVRIRLKRSDIKGPKQNIMLQSDRGDGVYMANLALPAKSSWQLTADLVPLDNKIVEFDLPVSVSVLDNDWLQVKLKDDGKATIPPGAEEMTIEGQYAVGRISKYSRRGERMFVG